MSDQVVFTETMDKFEIKTEHGSWVKVTEYIFRSYTGERRKNGKKYHGPVYYLGTNKEI